MHLPSFWRSTPPSKWLSKPQFLRLYNKYECNTDLTRFPRKLNETAPNRASPVLSWLTIMLGVLFLIGRRNTSELDSRIQPSEASATRRHRSQVLQLCWLNRAHMGACSSWLRLGARRSAVNTFSGWLMLAQRAWWRERTLGRGSRT